jgi:hypothetical protein
MGMPSEEIPCITGNRSDQSYYPTPKMNKTKMTNKTLMVLAGAVLSASASFGQVLYTEDFTDPNPRIDFPWLGGTGDTAYEPGGWVASVGESETGVKWGSTMVDGVATVNTYINNFHRAIALVLDLSVQGAGWYEVSFDVVGEPGGILSVAEIENLGAAMVNTAKISSEVFVPSPEGDTVVNNLLNADDTGWVRIADFLEGDRATIPFEFDGTGFVGFAISAYANSITIDNFEVAVGAEPDPFFSTLDADGGNWVKSPWFGRLQNQFTPYVYHEQMGWLYLIGNNENMTAYVYNLNRYIWTAEVLWDTTDVGFGWFYLFGADAGWYGFVKEDVPPGDYRVWSSLTGEYVQGTTLGI